MSIQGSARADPRFGPAARNHPHDLRQPLPPAPAPLGRRRRRHQRRTRQRTQQTPADARPVPPHRPRHRLQPDVRHDRVSAADVMPLYAEGYSLAEFLIQTGGRRKYVEFLGDGLKNDDWSGAVPRHYGIQGLGSTAKHLAGVGQAGLARFGPRDAQPAAAGRNARRQHSQQSKSAEFGIWNSKSRRRRFLGSDSGRAFGSCSRADEQCRRLGRESAKIVQEIRRPGRHSATRLGLDRAAVLTVANRRCEATARFDGNSRYFSLPTAGAFSATAADRSIPNSGSRSSTRRPTAPASYSGVECGGRTRAAGSRPEATGRHTPRSRGHV